jgi:hypothetical protein
MPQYPRRNDNDESEHDRQSVTEKIYDCADMSGAPVRVSLIVRTTLTIEKLGLSSKWSRVISASGHDGAPPYKKPDRVQPSARQWGV